MSDDREQGPAEWTHCFMCKKLLDEQEAAEGEICDTCYQELCEGDETCP